MLTGSVPKLLKEAHQVKEALEKIGEGLPDAISSDVMATKINALEAKVSEIEALFRDAKQYTGLTHAYCGCTCII